jgi:hypothetical protein
VKFSLNDLNHNTPEKMEQSDKNIVPPLGYENAINTSDLCMKGARQDMTGTQMDL